MILYFWMGGVFGGILGFAVCALMNASQKDEEARDGENLQ